MESGNSIFVQSLRGDPFRVSFSVFSFLFISFFNRYDRYIAIFLNQFYALRVDFNERELRIQLF